MAKIGGSNFTVEEALYLYKEKPSVIDPDFSTHGIYIMACADFLNQERKQEIFEAHRIFYEDNMQLCPDILKENQEECKQITDIYKVGITTKGIKRYEHQVRSCTSLTPDEDQWYFVSWYGYKTTGNKNGGLTCVEAYDKIHTVESWLKDGKPGNEKNLPFFKHCRRKDGVGGTELVYNLTLKQIRKEINVALMYYEKRMSLGDAFVPAGITYLKHWKNIWNAEQYKRHVQGGTDKEVTSLSAEYGGGNVVGDKQDANGEWRDKEGRSIIVIEEVVDDPRQMSAENKKAENRINALDDRLNGGTGKQESLKEENDNLKEENDNLKEENKSLRETNETLNAENAELKKQLREAAAKTPDLQRKKNSPTLTKKNNLKF